MDQLAGLVQRFVGDEQDFRLALHLHVFRQFLFAECRFRRDFENVLPGDNLRHLEFRAGTTVASGLTAVERIGLAVLAALQGHLDGAVGKRNIFQERFDTVDLTAEASGTPRIVDLIRGQ